MTWVIFNEHIYAPSDILFFYKCSQVLKILAAIIVIMKFKNSILLF